MCIRDSPPDREPHLHPPMFEYPLVAQQQAELQNPRKRHYCILQNVFFLTGGL